MPGGQRPDRHAARARPSRRERAAPARRAARSARARRGARVSPTRPRTFTVAATCRRRSPSSSAPWRCSRRATAPAPSCCRPWASRLFEASSLERAELVADEARGRRPGSRAPARRGRARAHARLSAPRSVDPAASLVVAEDAAVALEALGDDVGVARARYLMCELAWLQGASERGLREAREALRFARRGGGTVELDAGVSVIAWALVVNRVPVPARAGRVRRAAAQRVRAPLRRARRARLRRGAGRDGRGLRTGARAARCGRATGSTTSGCTRPRSGWRCSTPRPSCWPAIRRAPRPRWTTPSASRARSAIAGSSRRSCVDRAHVLLAQDRLAQAADAVAAHRRGPGPQRPRVAHQAARGPRQARRPRGPRRAGARGGAGRRRARRPDRAVPLPRRRVARPGRGGAPRGRGRGGGGRARDGARRSIAPRATSPPRASSRASAAAGAWPSRWTAGARRAPSVRRGSRAPRPGRPPAPRRPPSRAPSGARR